MLAGLKAEDNMIVEENNKILDTDGVAPDPDLMSSQHSVKLEHAKDVLRKNSNDYGGIRHSKTGSLAAASIDHRLQPIVEDESMEQSKMVSNDLDGSLAVNNNEQQEEVK